MHRGIEHRGRQQNEWPTPPLAPITPQPPAQRPPGVSPEAYQAAQARDRARQREISKAEQAGKTAGYPWGKAVAGFHEILERLPKLPPSRLAEARRRYSDDLAAALDALPLPPAYDDPVLHQAAIRGFELGAGMGYEELRQEMLAITVGSTIAEWYAGKAALAAHRALQRLGTFRFSLPIIGVGAGGIGFMRLGAGAFKRLPNEAALRQLAGEIQAAGKLPLSAQTVVLITTEEGPTIVAAGARDLTKAEVEFAQRRGLLIAREFPGAHGEITALYEAGERRFIPTGGVATNAVCQSGTGNCLTQMSRMAAQGRYAIQLSADGKAFRFIKR